MFFSQIRRTFLTVNQNCSMFKRSSVKFEIFTSTSKNIKVYHMNREKIYQKVLYQRSWKLSQYFAQLTQLNKKLLKSCIPRFPKSRTIPIRTLAAAICKITKQTKTKNHRPKILFVFLVSLVSARWKEEKIFFCTQREHAVFGTSQRRNKTYSKYFKWQIIKDKLPLHKFKKIDSLQTSSFV